MKRIAATLAVAAMALSSEAAWAAPVSLSAARPFFFALSVRDAEARDLSELEPPFEKRHLLRGVFKIGFAVDDLNAARAGLEGLDIPLRGEPIAEPDGSMRSLQIEDPDGKVIQLFELLEPESQLRLGRTQAAPSSQQQSDVG